MPTTMVRVRVDEKAKHTASKALAGMGRVRVPNAATAKAMRAADKGKGKRTISADALFKDLGI